MESIEQRPTTLAETGKGYLKRKRSSAPANDFNGDTEYIQWLMSTGMTEALRKGLCTTFSTRAKTMRSDTNKATMQNIGLLMNLNKVEGRNTANQVLLHMREALKGCGASPPAPTTKAKKSAK